ncbi:hypothetical protein [Amycolatopsis sp. GM8]|uniref:hypothetical protein n=1 Tax=Amycolatopsis sp. GM8 TaxID=2896530 RepID=UPI001F30FCF8|nr:hypothetical protein [Amycolatopsis sp. GM8]
MTVEAPPDAAAAPEEKRKPTPFKRAKADAVVPEVDEDAVDVDVDEAEPEPEPEPEQRRPWSKVTIAIGALLCALCVAALVFGGIFGSKLLSDKQRNDDRAAALDAGRQVAINLATINYATGKQDIQRILSTGTGDFANQFQANVDSYLDLVNQAQVVSTGKVAESGITSLDGNDAKVLVAITSSVKNKDDKAGEDRWYRMSIELQRQGDGRWLASRVEFVQ